MPMVQTQTLAAFGAAAVLLSLAPGPDNVFVLMQSAQRGWRAGLCVVCGLCCGLMLHTAAVALGLAAVVAAKPALFAAIKLCGAAYLLWLAWGALHSPVHEATVQTPGLGARQPHPMLTLRQALRWVGRGILMNVSNPKVLIFFLAFLPGFVEPTLGSVAQQTLLLGGVFILATFLVFGSIACAAGWFGSLLRGSAWAQQWLNRATALVFLALAVHLAL